MHVAKKSFLTSTIFLLLCFVLLVGTTLAWFTDSVANTGNAIQAGTLSIDAVAYDLDMKNTSGTAYRIDGVNGGKKFYFEADGQDLKDENAPAIIGEALWEPGKSNAKLLEVKNSGSLAAKIKLSFDVTDGGLMDALWFDFVQVDENGGIVGTFQERPMSSLDAVAENLELPLAAEGGTVRFILVYGMKEEAGNTYQGKGFSANVRILAAQDTVEKDGFGSAQYDAAAGYAMVDVSNEAELLAAIENGQSVRLTESITLSESVTFDRPTVLSLNGNTIALASSLSNKNIKTTDSLIVEGNGTIEGALVVDKGATLVINAGENFRIESHFNTGAAISAGLNTTIEINGGTYTSYEKGGSGVINSFGNDVIIRNAAVNVGVDSMSQSAGIVAANAKETLLENVTVNARYGIAVKLNTSMSGAATIIGGTFTTDRVAEGWKPNDTIRYGGTLTISDATINRIGTGILYYKAWPLPTEIVGLTQENVTFHQMDDTAAAYEDVNYYSF